MILIKVIIILILKNLYYKFKIVKQYFPSLNEQIIRGQLRDLNAKPSYDNNRIYKLDNSL